MKTKQENLKYSMRKQLGTCSELVSFYERQRNWDNYERRIKAVKPTLQTIYKHNSEASCQIKRQPLAEFNRILTINIQNKALLKKLTSKSGHKISWNAPHKLIKNNRKEYYENHKKKLDNKGMMRRIKESKSAYKVSKYIQERRLTQRYINSICRFGYKNYTPNKTLLPNNISPSFHPSTQKSDKKLSQIICSENKIQDKANRSLKKIQKIIPQKKINVEGQVFTCKGVIWQDEITIEIQSKNREAYVLELKKETVKEQFGENFIKFFRKLNIIKQDGDFVLKTL